MWHILGLCKKFWATASENTLMFWNRWGASMLSRCWTTVMKVSIPYKNEGSVILDVLPADAVFSRILENT
jgi:hypothetical protein